MSKIHEARQPAIIQPWKWNGSVLLSAFAPLCLSH